MKALLETLRTMTSEQISPPAMGTLMILLSGKSLKMTHISNLCGISTASMTGIADRLSRMGYVVRVEGDDRREKYLELTPKGTDKIQEMLGYIYPCGIEDGVREQFNEYIDSVCESSSPYLQPVASLPLV